MLRLLTHSTVLALVLTGTACSSGSGSKVKTDASNTVHGFDSDVVTPVDAPPEVDAAILDFDADSTPVPPPDATPLPFDPDALFPTCQGTPQQVSDCIINLQTRSGIPVTRPEPMDYSLCRP